MDERNVKDLTDEQLEAISYIKRMSDDQIRLVFERMAE